MTIAESWHDLETDLLGEEPDYDAEPPVEIDRTVADRYLRRIAHLDAQQVADAEVAQAQIEQVQAWLARRYETHAAQRAWLSGVLRRFHEAVLTIDPKAKTIHLPAGDLKMRAQQDAVTVDGEQYLPWAEAHRPDTLRVIPETKAVDLRTVRAALVNGCVIDADGEVAPGVTVEARGPKFSIDLGAEDAPEPV